MNNQLLLIDGITCFSLSLNSVPRKQSIFTPSLTERKAVSTSRRVILSRAGSQRTMKFQSNEDSDTSYMKRLKGYLDFLFKMNYSNSIYVSLQFGEDNDKSLSKDSDYEILNQTNNPIFRYKVYVGPGNGCKLIKSLLKRRFWV